jgi:hypothetical protein
LNLNFLIWIHSLDFWLRIRQKVSDPCGSKSTTLCHMLIYPSKSFETCAISSVPELHHFDAAADPALAPGSRIMWLRLRFRLLSISLYSSKLKKLYILSCSSSSERNDTAPCGSGPGSGLLNQCCGTRAGATRSRIIFLRNWSRNRILRYKFLKLPLCKPRERIRRRSSINMP